MWCHALLGSKWVRFLCVAGSVQAVAPFMHELNFCLINYCFVNFKFFYYLFKIIFVLIHFFYEKNEARKNGF